MFPCTHLSLSKSEFQRGIAQPIMLLVKGFMGQCPIQLLFNETIYSQMLTFKRNTKSRTYALETQKTREPKELRYKDVKVFFLFTFCSVFHFAVSLQQGHLSLFCCVCGWNQLSLSPLVVKLLLTEFEKASPVEIGLRLKGLNHINDMSNTDRFVLTMSRNGITCFQQ